MCKQLSTVLCSALPSMNRAGLGAAYSLHLTFVCMTLIVVATTHVLSPKASEIGKISPPRESKGMVIY